MKVLRTVLLVAVALALVACSTVQCGVGERVSQSITVENNGLALLAVIVVFGCFFLALLVGSGGLGGGHR